MSGWTRGNRLRLLENGEEFFPRVCEAIRSARTEVVLETFLWFEDEVGRQLQGALVEAAARGARVLVTVDGYGSPGFSPGFLEQLTDAGVRIHSFDPQPTFFRIRTNILCRLHRKIVVVDRELAFVGGINFTEDHLRSFGDRSKQDYAVEVNGPVVRDIHAFCRFGKDVHAGSWRRIICDGLHQVQNVQTAFRKALRSMSLPPSNSRWVWSLRFWAVSVAQRSESSTTGGVDKT